MKKSQKGEQISMLGEEKTKSKKKKEETTVVEEKIIFKDIDAVLHESMIPYSEHVILDRALPRVEDGLKPVQRRILYTMLELGLTPDKPFRKSARIVGDCLGKYHPHGDSSVYDAMVRMAQNFNMGATLVEGHGNYGSIDGDSAAAMRYTEAKMTPFAMTMLKDLEKDTVPWSFNFDDTLKEPDMLPAGYPNLLVNGAMGIAVGLATNIPTHNLGETIDAVVSYIDKPKITLDEMMKVIPAPDFPTGGQLIIGDDLKHAYETGKGKLLIRSKYHIEEKDDKKSIVIDEIPYQVNKAVMLQKIVELKEDKGKVALAGIAEVRDESDRKGMRAVIRLKKDVDAEPIIAYLLKYSNLQVQYNINMIAIAGGKPKQLGLMDIIKYYVDYRQNVILRRTKYDLDIAKQRAHIVEGLLIAIRNIDEVIQIIKTSESTSVAKQRLKERFELSEKQAQAILDMRLARLTSLEVYKLEEELAGLKKTIEELSAIVASPKKQLAVVKSELLALKKEHKTPRRSVIIHESEDVVIKENTEQTAIIKEVVIGISATNNIKAIPVKNFNQSQKEFGSNSNMNEVHKQLIATTSDKTLLMITNLGNCFKLKVDSIPEAKFKEKGTAISKLIELKKGENVVFAFVLEKNVKECMYMFTELGMVKKMLLSDFDVAKGCYSVINLKDEDEIISCSMDNGFADRMVCVTRLGNVLVANLNDIPEQGRSSQGVKAILLNTGDSLVGAELSEGDGEIITVTSKAYAKRTIIAQIDMLPRARKGVKISPLDGSCGDEIVFAKVVKWPYSIVIQDINGITVAKNSEDLQIVARTSAGKSITRSKAGLVVSMVSKYVTEC